MKCRRFLRHILHLAIVIVWGAAGVALSAQTTIGGTVSDGQGGPLLSGQIYVVTNHITVPAGQTLTIQPGAILKLYQTIEIDVFGTLNAQGTVAQPIAFTDYRDDTIGGDTNQNGTTNGGPNWWRGITFFTGSAGTLNRVTVRYAGEAGHAGVAVVGSSPALTNVTIDSCSNAALGLSGAAATPTVTSCNFVNSGRAVDGVYLTSIPGFSNNTASGNVLSDVMNVVNTDVTTNTTINATNLIGGVAVFAAHVSVPTGSTLTLNAGVILKMNQTIQWTVNGTLIVNGTGTAPVVVTDVRDDAVGGDTNKNGATNGGANWWRGIIFNATSDASSLNHLNLRYAGESSFGAFEIVDADITMNACSVYGSSNACVDFNGTNSHPQITACNFTNSGYAVENVPFNSVPSFLNCTASGNSVSDVINVTSATLSANLTIGAQNLISGALRMSSHVLVPQAYSLTVGAGVVFKMNQTIQWTIDGTLTTNGTTTAPVVFTDIRDDQIAGDTNKNGVTSGGPNWWRGIIFNATSGASSLTATVLRYAGESSFAAIEIVGSGASFHQCVVDSCSNASVDFNNTACSAAFIECVFMNNSRGVEGVRIESLGSFYDCTSQNNGTTDTVLVSDGNVLGNATIDAHNLVGGVIYMTNHVTVAAGATLTIGPGVIVKMAQTIQWTINGTLNIQGTAAEPVVFTDYRDDAIGGDTNHNGPTSGASNWWRGITFNAGSDASTLDNFRIRYAGEASFAALEIAGASITARDLTVESCSNAAIDLNLVYATPTIERATFHACARTVEGCSMASIVAMRELTATSCGAPYTAIVSNFSGTGTHVHDWNAVNGVVYIAAHQSIGAAEDLTLEAGLVVKMAQTIQWTVFGKLEILGTGARPVVFTDIRDDSFGGDSNTNGVTSGGANWWRGINWTAGATAATVENLRLRFAGESSWTGVTCASPAVTLRRVRVENSSNAGFAISAAAGRADDLVAFANGGTGILLSGGATVLAHATATSNGGYGIQRTAGTATVSSSISWANGAANFQGFATSDLSHSDGSATAAGSFGNINLNPLFVNAAAGDLRLQSTSPCIDAAEDAIAFAVLLDHDERPRAVDGRLLGTAPASDMGAFEFTAFELDVLGVPRNGTALDLTVTGPIGSIGITVVGLLDGAQPVLANGSPAYGYLTVGLVPTVLLIGVQPAGVTQTVNIPNLPYLEGYSFGLQGLGILGSNTTIGDFTNRWRATLYN